MPDPDEAVTAQDLLHLRHAIAVAAEARADGRQPFGAVIVNEHGKVLVAARNNAVRPTGDPTQHAETLACAEAAKRFSDAELDRCTLYTSTEPCAMCAGAIFWSGIGRVVYALAETDLLKFTGEAMFDLPCREVFARARRRIVVLGPLLEEEASKVHEGFWTV